MMCSSVSEVKWFFSGRDLPVNAVVSRSYNLTGSILTLIRVTKNNAGRYTCQGQDKEDNEYNYFISYTSVWVSGKLSQIKVV